MWLILIWICLLVICYPLILNWMWLILNWMWLILNWMWLILICTWLILICPQKGVAQGYSATSQTKRVEQGKEQDKEIVSGCVTSMGFRSDSTLTLGVGGKLVDESVLSRSRSSVGRALDSVWWQHTSRFQKSGVWGATGARCLSSILAGMVAVGGRP